MYFSDGTLLLRWPLARHSLTAGWFYPGGAMHGAIDLAAKVGEPVFAAETGTVDWVQQWDGHTKDPAKNQSYGNLVRIRHPDHKGKPLQTLYAHLQRCAVGQGQQVQEGEIIGYAGNTGNSTGPHLHFEVRLSGKRTNPLVWLDDDFFATPGWQPFTYRPGEHPVQRPEQPLWGRGIDISRHQWGSPVDFDAVRAAGARFVILRAGYGWGRDQIDPCFEKGYALAVRAGLEVGAYWYSYAQTPQQARQEAELCLLALRGKRLGMGVWFDQEYEPGIVALTNTQRTELVEAFCGTLAKERMLCGLYCSRDWINNRLDADRLKGIQLWVAAYTERDSPGETALTWGIWQHAGNAGRWPGVVGPCDLDVCRRDYPALMREEGLCGYGKEADNGGNGMNWIEVKDKRLKALTDKPACETFPQADTGTGPVVKVPAGDSVQVLAVTDQQYTIAPGVPAAPWYKVQMQAGVRYAIGLSDRWQLVDAPKEPQQPDEKPEQPEEKPEQPGEKPDPGRISITFEGLNLDQAKRVLSALEGAK